MTLPAYRSIPTLDSLERWLQQKFGLGAPLSCELIRWNWNDTYRVIMGEQRFILRIYGSDHRDDDAIQYELDLIAHLKQGGIGACGPVPSLKGAESTDIQLAEGARTAVLFEHAAGRVAPLVAPHNPSILGTALARLHNAAERFDSERPRAAICLEIAVRETLDALPDLLPGGGEQVGLVRGIGSQVLREFETLDRARLDAGPIHGDPFSNNVAIDPHGAVAWYDFDECRPGERATDLTVPYWVFRTRNRPELWDELLASYRAERELSDIDVRAVPILCAAQLVAAISELTKRCSPILGTDIARSLLLTRMSQLRSIQSWFSGT